MLGAAIVWATLVGYVCTIRYLDFGADAFDLGNYNQVFWTAAVDHLNFYTSVGLADRGGWVILGHFSPLFYLLLPFYLLAPGAPALLYIQAAALAVGALPAYGLAREIFQSPKWGLGFAVVYLTSPLTFWPAWFDFHPETLFVAPVLGAFYFLQLRRPIPLLLCLLIGMMAIETVAPFLIVFFGFALVPSVWKGLRRQASLFADRILWAGLLLSLAYLGISFAVTSLNSPNGATFGTTIGAWSQLGAPDTWRVFPTAILHPGRAGAALQIYGEQKGIYITMVLASVGFLPLLGPVRYAAPGYVWLALISLSNNLAFVSLGDMYCCYVAPFFLVASIYGLARLRSWARERSVLPSSAGSVGRGGFPAPGTWSGRSLALSAAVGMLIVGILVANAIGSPLNANAIDYYPGIPPGVPAATAHDAWATELLSMIPSEASVLTGPHDFPLVSDRRDAYNVPVFGPVAHNFSFEQALQAMINASSYLFLDWIIDDLTSTLIIEYGNLSGFGLLAAADGIDLWERGYDGALEVWEPWTLAVPGGDMTAGDAVQDSQNASPLGSSLYHAPGVANGTMLWTGLGVLAIPPGEYSMTARIAIDSPSPGPIAEVSASMNGLSYTEVAVARNAGISRFQTQIEALPTPTILGQDLMSTSPASGAYQEGNITLDFAWNGPGYLFTKGWVLAPDASVRLYSITLEQLDP